MAVNTIQRKKPRKISPNRLATAKKNLGKIQKQLEPFTPKKRIERFSTAGTWKDASNLFIGEDEEITFNY